MKDLNEIMQAVGLKNKDVVTDIHISKDKVPIFLDKNIINKVIKSLNPDGLTLEQTIEHFLIMKAREKNFIKETDKPDEVALDITDYYFIPQKKKNIFDFLYRKPEIKFTWFWDDE